ncbi:hypothetical protein MG293_016069 [Ovis ammon polii]|uniref:Uncharacterized protein n=1 Tax=Ovis ammon polii TaxID=230172 RepID=A0AAD4Y0E8_OVIAM|nr:hypothetical protein MG293_016069 [Ovis ammon polii]KAI4555892.1 hypothetical protein MJT46_014515 [Ovis ammon polii x Ovis aries]
MPLQDEENSCQARSAQVYTLRCNFKLKRHQIKLPTFICKPVPLLSSLFIRTLGQKLQDSLGPGSLSRLQGQLLNHVCVQHTDHYITKCRCFCSLELCSLLRGKPPGMPLGSNSIFLALNLSSAKTVTPQGPPSSLSPPVHCLSVPHASEPIGP